MKTVLGLEKWRNGSEEIKKIKSSHGLGNTTTMEKRPSGCSSSSSSTLIAGTTASHCDVKPPLSTRKGGAEERGARVTKKIN